MTVIGQTPVELLLGCTAVLFGLSVLSVTVGRRLATPLVYGGCLLVCLAGLAIALGHLLGATGGDSTAILPLGLPWVGARFRLDALASVFLVVVNLGAAAASLYAIGYGRHEPEPRRVLPFYPAFLAAMNLVIGGLIAAALIGQRLSVAGSFVFGASSMALGMFFSAVALARAQVTENSHVASGLAGAVLAVAFMLRALGDILVKVVHQHAHGGFLGPSLAGELVAARRLSRSV